VKAGVFGVGALLAVLACSSPTDIVGVVDGADAEVPADEGAADPDQTVDDTSGAADVALLLAGRPMADWDGDALAWPLSTPLAELFADTTSFERDARDERTDRDDRDDRAQLSPWQSRRLAPSPSRGSSRAGEVGARASAFEARLLILDEDEARELLALLPSAASPDAERAAVFRDVRGDVYQVSLESDDRSLELGCLGRMHREQSECGGRGPFD